MAAPTTLPSSSWTSLPLKKFLDTENYVQSLPRMLPTPWWMIIDWIVVMSYLWTEQRTGRKIMDRDYANTMKQSWQQEETLKDTKYRHFIQWQYKHRFNFQYDHIYSVWRRHLNILKWFPLGWWNSLSRQAGQIPLQNTAATWQHNDTTIREQRWSVLILTA